MIAGICKPAAAQWAEASGPNSAIIYCFASAGANLFAGYQKGVFVSTDNGANWTTYNNTLSSYAVQCLAATPDGKGGTILIAGSGGYGLYRSMDNSKTWNALPVSYELGRTTSFAVVESKIFAGTDGGVFVSADGGDTWDSVRIGLPANERAKCFAFGSKVFVVSVNGLIFSPDGGATWTSADSSVTQAAGMAATGTSLFVSVDSVFRSMDDGKSWVGLNNGLGAGAYNRAGALAVSGNNVFAGTSSKGIFLSKDNGATWTPFSSGLANNGVPDAYSQVYSLAVTDSFVLAGFYQHGIWRRPLTETTSSVAEHPSEIDINPAILYPNPASASITLGGLEGINEVRILDAAGREVLLQKVSGMIASINVSTLSTGVYSAVLLRSNGTPAMRWFTVIH